MAWYKHTPTELGWFWRGTQSAIFFYVSCTPCIMYSSKKKQQKENKRAMAERVEQMRRAEGMVYGQPLPFQTNEAWRSEIELGPERPLPDSVTDVPQANDSHASSPSRPSTNGYDERHRPPSSRQEARASGRAGSRRDNGSMTKKEKARSKRDVKERTPVATDTGERTDRGPSVPKSKEASSKTPEDREIPSMAAHRSGPGSSAGGDGSLESTTIVNDSTDHCGEGGSVTSGEGASGKKRRYQRPVEPLWGITDGFGPLEKLHGYTEPEPVPAWYVQRNPEVNDLHPPVVSSLPKTKKEALWMLQPPPPAAFMEGRTSERETTPRSRATTATTRSTSRSTRLSASPKTQRSRAKPKHRRPSPADSSSSQDDVPRRKRRPKPLATIASHGI